MIVIAFDKIIGDYEADDTWLREELKKAGGEEVKVEISSPGGLIRPGLAMFNLLTDYGNVWTHIIGFAASMASYLALAGKKRTATNNAVFYVHNAQGGIIGDYRDFYWGGQYFEGLSNLLAKQYAETSGKKILEIRDMMDKDTALFGDEIAKAGFVSEIVQSGKKEDRNEMIAFAQMAIDDCILKVRELDKDKNDLRQAAAYIPVSVNSVGTYSSDAKLVDESWDAGESEKRWRKHANVESSDDLPNAVYRKRFAWYDSGNQGNFASYKFPHWDYKNGEFVNIAAVRNGLARLSQSDIPAAEKTKVESLLRKYLDRFNKEKDEKNPAGAGKNNINGGVRMTLEEFKAQHPHLYNEVFSAGMEAGKAGMQENIDAHLEWIEADQKGVVEALKNGEVFNSKHLSAYNKAAMKNQSLQDRNDDDPPPVTTDDKNDKESFNKALDKALDEKFGVKPEGGK